MSSPIFIDLFFCAYCYMLTSFQHMMRVNDSLAVLISLCLLITCFQAIVYLYRIFLFYETDVRTKNDPFFSTARLARPRRCFGVPRKRLPSVETVLAGQGSRGGGSVSTVTVTVIVTVMQHHGQTKAANYTVPSHCGKREYIVNGKCISEFCCEPRCKRYCDTGILQFYDRLHMITHGNDAQHPAHFRTPTSSSHRSIQSSIVYQQSLDFIHSDYYDSIV